MSRQPIQGPALERLDAEKVAYWYFRLNGFLQIENFVVHPERRGSQRTDADLLGVRFPYRAERLFDDPDDIMADDEQRLALSRDLIDVVIAEVKTNQPCTLNGPWTRRDRRNVHRVFAAIGCLPHPSIPEAAECIYEKGVAVFGGTRIRLMSVGRNESADLRERYPGVLQLTWNEIIGFVWDRFRAYLHQKRNVEQWDDAGRVLRQLAESSDRAGFVVEIARRIGSTPATP